MTYLAIILLISFSFNNCMEKPKQQNIPRSIIKGQGAIAADLSSLNGKGKILFVNPKCVVVGIENLPYRLFITCDFRDDNLPLILRGEIYNVKELIMKPTFSVGDFKEIENCAIPKWLSNFKNITCLRFQHIKVDDLFILKDLPIQHLILEKINFDDSQKIIDAIRQFKQLKEISYDRSLPKGVIHSIEKLNVKLTPVIY